jgi:hypothetical protein
MHTMPHQTPFEPIDFLRIALNWWNHWLRGIENGVMDEPAVTVFVQGADPGWSSLTNWPPEGSEAVFETGATRTLTASAGPDQARSELGRYEPDGTIGSTAGLWSSIGKSFGLPVDQHEDDRRSFSVETDPFDDNATICGRPRVVVDLLDRPSGPARLAVRLSEVDGDGRSTLITSGLCMSGGEVVLDPTAYQVEAGRKLRVAISDSEFPRVWPNLSPCPLVIGKVELDLPLLRSEQVCPAAIRTTPAAPDSSDPNLWAAGRWDVREKA